MLPFYISFATPLTFYGFSGGKWLFDETEAPAGSAWVYWLGEEVWSQDPWVLLEVQQGSSVPSSEGHQGRL